MKPGLSVIVACLLCWLVGEVAAQTVQRISILYMDRSVGKSIYLNAQDPRAGYRDIRAVLDTLNVGTADRKARFVFRNANMNGEPGPAVTETIPNLSPYVTANEITTYYLLGGDGFRIATQSLLRVFADTCKYSAVHRVRGDTTTAYDLFLPHRVRTSVARPQDTVTEKYDLVIIGEPYITWTKFVQAKADSMKITYRAIRDSVANHPEIHLALAFGTPLTYQESTGMNFEGDTSMAKTAFQLAVWFRDSLANTPGTPVVPNFWAFDSYTSLCELSEGTYNRYCLRTDYWAGATGQSHLSPLGAAVGQDTLISFIRQAALRILSRSGGQTVTQADLESKIRDFRDGKATAQEVLDLIDRYYGK